MPPLHQDLEVIRSAYEALSRRDLDAFLEFLDAEVELVEPKEIPGGSTHRGRDEVGRFLRFGLEAWSRYSITPSQLFRVGDRVVALLEVTARGQASGVETRARTGHVLSLDDGLATRVEMYGDWEQARQAAGLSESVRRPAPRPCRWDSLRRRASERRRGHGHRRREAGSRRGEAGRGDPGREPGDGGDHRHRAADGGR